MDNISGPDRSALFDKPQVLPEQEVVKNQKVAAGDLGGKNNLQVTDSKGGSVPLGSANEPQKPSLDKPGELKPDQAASGPKMVKDLTQETKSAFASATQLYHNVLNGTVTEAEVKKLNDYAQMLDQTASLLDKHADKVAKEGDSQSPMTSGEYKQVANLLRANGEGMRQIASGRTFADLKVLEQLVDIYAVMELLHKMSAEQRSQARENRATEYDAAKNSILSQADNLKSAAIMSAIGGWASAGTKIVAGGAQMGLAVRAGNAPNQGAMQQQVAVSNGLSQVISASGDMVKAGTDFQAGMHQAEVKILEAEQRTHDNAAQSSSEFMNLHQDMMKTVLSKMDEVMRSWFETLKSTTRA